MTRDTSSQWKRQKLISICEVSDATQVICSYGTNNSKFTQKTSVFCRTQKFKLVGDIFRIPVIFLSTLQSEICLRNPPLEVSSSATSVEIYANSTSSPHGPETTAVASYRVRRSVEVHREESITRSSLFATISARWENYGHLQFLEKSP